MSSIITCTGAESSGKTTLALALSEHFNEPYVEEFARVYLDEIDRPYVQADLLHIAKGQLDSIKEAQKKATNFLFVDTDLWTIYIWNQVKYDKKLPGLEAMAASLSSDLYLLCDWNIPWEYDPQRESEHGREALFLRYEELLQEKKFPYQIVSGSKEKRLRDAIELIKQS